MKLETTSFNDIWMSSIIHVHNTIVRKLIYQTFRQLCCYVLKVFSACLFLSFEVSNNEQWIWKTIKSVVQIKSKYKVDQTLEA